MAQKIALAIDMGGSKCLCGLIRADGTVLAKHRFEWVGKVSGTAVESQVIAQAHRMLEQFPLYSPDVIGATIPGLTNHDDGLWVEACFSGICNIPIAADLKKEFMLPCYVDNDANAAALAEKCYGGARSLNNFLYITVSNGIGGAAYCDGHILRGQDNTAFEIGHCLAVEKDGRLCGCGNRGCLEMHASGLGLARNYVELGGTPMPDGQLAQCAEIARRAQQGDAAAIATFELEGRYLGKALAVACNLFNPQKVFVGGGVSLVFELFRQPMQAEFSAHLYRRANSNVTIECTSLGYDGALLGAAALAFEGLEQNCLKESLLCGI